MPPGCHMMSLRLGDRDEKMVYVVNLKKNYLKWAIPVLKIRDHCIVTKITIINTLFKGPGGLKMKDWLPLVSCFGFFEGRGESIWHLLNHSVGFLQEKSPL